MSANQLARIESLGDNCELGLALRRLGHNSGSLFRWASMQPPQLLAMLKNDLSGIYQFDDLEPLRSSMVLDRRYGVGWHTEMVCVPGPTGLAFRDGRKVRRGIHRHEKHKLDYLIAKFRSRARSGGIVYVVKSNAGIDPTVVLGLRDELERLCDGGAFALVEVLPPDDMSKIGTVEAVGDRLFRGFVRSFAPYERADEGDTDVWATILGQALDLNPCHDWLERSEAAQAASLEPSNSLSFPGEDGAPAAAIGQLIGGNEWCRRVGSDFRLHGAESSEQTTILRWPSLGLAGRHYLSGTIRSALGDAAPVSVMVRVRDSAQTDVRELRSIVSPDAPWLVDIAIDPDELDDVVFEIDVRATRQLAQGERAVVDVSPMRLHRA